MSRNSGVSKLVEQFTHEHIITVLSAGRDNRPRVGDRKYFMSKN